MRAENERYYDERRKREMKREEEERLERSKHRNPFGPDDCDACRSGRDASR